MAGRGDCALVSQSSRLSPTAPRSGFPARVERLCGLYPAPGFCDEELIFYRVSDLSAPPQDSTRHADEDEYIEPRNVRWEARGIFVGNSKTGRSPASCRRQYSICAEDLSGCIVLRCQHA